MSGHREAHLSLVDALLAATPVVPEGVPDEVLLDAARIMVATREAILATAELAPLVPPGEDVPAPSEKIAELTSRQAAWNDALAEARTRTGSHRVATGKLRAYRTRQP